MNNQEAKFILGAYRPDGRDAADPAFAEALAQAGRDPELRTWLERERKFDTVLAAKLREVAPPPELRASILAGGRASQPRRRWWTHPAWLAAAAVVVVLGAVAIKIAPRGGSAELGEIAAFALRDLNEAHNQHVGYPEGLGAVQAQLASVRAPVIHSLGAAVNLDELRRKNCRSVRVAGREIFEICFERDGTWYHLFAMEHNDPRGGAIDSKPLMSSAGEYTVAAWRDAKLVYALVARGEEALRKLI